MFFAGGSSDLDHHGCRAQIQELESKLAIAKEALFDISEQEVSSDIYIKTQEALEKTK